MDERGLIPEQLAAEAVRSKAAMLYSIPSFHNPTGILMDAGRRRELMEVTGRLGLPILEDGAYQELWLDVPPPPPLKALDQEGRVLHLGTLSKAVSPGLRIGWIVGPEPVVRRLADIKMQSDYGASSLSQLAAASWLTGAITRSTCRCCAAGCARAAATCLSCCSSIGPDWQPGMCRQGASISGCLSTRLSLRASCSAQR